ncbi:hypothetical protein HDE76_001491 [Rhodanobacter sp. ANJX3]|uniref:hypothetical protein n=1 Tax=Rhodanobacter sp. ANJX3 TaxID=2723083 RepID=UPI00160E7BA1|nr:hypothetical protein [Rhodanobacter sp. ANJX3]MBB5358285.1 hypothetical protein [Rhodanobacter sp. ANJX3]
MNAEYDQFRNFRRKVMNPSRKSTEMNARLTKTHRAGIRVQSLGKTISILFFSVLLISNVMSQSAPSNLISSNAANSGQPNRTNPPDAQPYLRDNPPYTNDVMWGKIISLIQLHGGYVEPQDLESTFNVKSIRDRNFGSSGYSAHLISSSSWNLNITYVEYFKKYVLDGKIINPGGKMSILNINWPFYLNDKKECINAGNSIKELSDLGWFTKAEKEKNVTPLSSEFRTSNASDFVNSKNKSRVVISYGDNKDFIDPIKPDQACVFIVEIYGRL